MLILLIEDDYMTAELIGRKLRHYFKIKPDELTEIATELEFRQNLDQMAQDKPNVILLDVMLQWTEVSDAIEPRPEDVRAGGKYRAGFRCLKLLAEHKGTRNIPVVLYSAMGKPDLESDLQTLPPHVKFVLKDSDFESLMGELRPLLNRP